MFDVPYTYILSDCYCYDYDVCMYDAGVGQSMTWAWILNSTSLPADILIIPFNLTPIPNSNLQQLFSLWYFT